MNRVAVLLAEGFEEIEALTVVDVLRRANIQCDIISINLKVDVKGAHNIVVKADYIVDDKALEEYSMIVLPGGSLGAENLSKSKIVLNTVEKFMNDKSKYVAAICASPAVVLSKIDSTKGKIITSYPGKDFELMLKNSIYKNEIVVQDENLITSRGPATTLEFAFRLVEVLQKNSKNLKEGMLYNMLLNNSRNEI